MRNFSKHYIEDVLPLRELNKYAQRGGGVGSLNAMHPYFAQRPVTASCAITSAALADAPRTEEERKTPDEVMIGLSGAEWPDEPAQLELARERVAAGGAVPLVDILHAACLLWGADRQEEFSSLVATRDCKMWPVVQAIVELLPRDNAERKARLSLRGPGELLAVVGARSMGACSVRAGAVEAVGTEQ